MYFQQITPARGGMRASIMALTVSLAVLLTWVVAPIAGAANSSGLFNAETPQVIKNQIYDPKGQLGKDRGKVEKTLKDLQGRGVELYVALPADFGTLSAPDWNTKALEMSGAGNEAYMLSLLTGPTQYAYMASPGPAATLNQDTVSALARDYLLAHLNEGDIPTAITSFAEQLGNSATKAGVRGGSNWPVVLLIVANVLVLGILIFAVWMYVKRGRANTAARKSSSDSSDAEDISTKKPVTHAKTAAHEAKERKTEEKRRKAEAKAAAKAAKAKAKKELAAEKAAKEAEAKAAAKAARQQQRAEEEARRNAAEQARIAAETAEREATEKAAAEKPAKIAAAETAEAAAEREPDDLPHVPALPAVPVLRTEQDEPQFGKAALSDTVMEFTSVTEPAPTPEPELASAPQPEPEPTPEPAPAPEPEPAPEPAPAVESVPAAPAPEPEPAPAVESVPAAPPFPVPAAPDFLSEMLTADNLSRSAGEDLATSNQVFGRSAAMELTAALSQLHNAVNDAYRELANAQLQSRDIRADQIREQLAVTEPAVREEVKRYVQQRHIQYNFNRLAQDLKTHSDQARLDLGKADTILDKLPANLADFTGAFNRVVVSALEQLDKVPSDLADAQAAANSGKETESAVASRSAEERLQQAESTVRMVQGLATHIEAQQHAESIDTLDNQLEALVSMMAALDEMITAQLRTVMIPARTMLQLANRTLNKCDQYYGSDDARALHYLKQARQQALQAARLAAADIDWRKEQ
ncbi:MAG: hypothetical protein SOS98_06850 [Varibaculum sp.]|nr:hypothetical protein [Varibaculum sp.]